MAKENLRDRFGHQIFGRMLFKWIYLQKSRSKNISIKKFSILNHDVYLTPGEIFEPFVEISNDLNINTDAYLNLLERM